MHLQSPRRAIRALAGSGEKESASIAAVYTLHRRPQMHFEAPGDLGRQLLTGRSKKSAAAASCITPQCFRGRREQRLCSTFTVSKENQPQQQRHRMKEGDAEVSDTPPPTHTPLKSPCYCVSLLLLHTFMFVVSSALWQVSLWKEVLCVSTSRWSKKEILEKLAAKRGSILITLKITVMAWLALVGLWF